MIYENSRIKIEREPSSIPWLKIFTQASYKELSDCPDDLRHYLYEVANVIEKNMLAYYQADKINIASFANMLPRVHIHVQARFKEDAWFPQPTWGKQQRDGVLELAKFAPFAKQVQADIEKLSH